MFIKNASLNFLSNQHEGESVGTPPQSLDDIWTFIACLDVPLIVHSIKMSSACSVLRREQPLWQCHHEYITVGKSVLVYAGVCG